MRRNSSSPWMKVLNSTCNFYVHIKQKWEQRWTQTYWWLIRSRGVLKWFLRWKVADYLGHNWNPTVNGSDSMSGMSQKKKKQTHALTHKKDSQKSTCPVLNKSTGVKSRRARANKEQGKKASEVRSKQWWEQRSGETEGGRRCRDIGLTCSQQSAVGETCQTPLSLQRWAWPLCKLHGNMNNNSSVRTRWMVAHKQHWLENLMAAAIFIRQGG